MISFINLDRRPLLAGKARSIAINGSQPIRVRIKCFVFKPPPPDYKPCGVCGVLTLGSGEPGMITADRETFSEHGGELVLQIQDAQGDQKEIRLKVEALVNISGGKPAQATAGEAAATAGEPAGMAEADFAGVDFATADFAEAVGEQAEMGEGEDR